MIFLNLLNRIFGPKKPLHRQEIDDYKKGTGNTHDIEEKAADTDLNSEALEGWTSVDFSVKDGMTNVDKKMNNFLSGQSNPRNGGNKGMILSFVLLVFTLWFLFILTYKETKLFAEQTIL